MYLADVGGQIEVLLTRSTLPVPPPHTHTHTHIHMQDGQRALMLAAKAGKWAVVQLLAEAHAPLDDLDKVSTSDGAHHII